MSNINDLREELFKTMKGLSDGSVDIDKARAISEVAKQITDTARVEVEFAKATGAQVTDFIAPDKATKTVGNKTVHRLVG